MVVIAVVVVVMCQGNDEPGHVHARCVPMHVDTQDAVVELTRAKHTTHTHDPRYT